MTADKQLSMSHTVDSVIITLPTRPYHKALYSRCVKRNSRNFGQNHVCGSRTFRLLVHCTQRCDSSGNFNQWRAKNCSQLTAKLAAFEINQKVPRHHPMHTERIEQSPTGIDRKIFKQRQKKIWNFIVSRPIEDLSNDFRWKISRTGCSFEYPLHDHSINHWWSWKPTASMHFIVNGNVCKLKLTESSAVSSAKCMENDREMPDSTHLSYRLENLLTKTMIEVERF